MVLFFRSVPFLVFLVEEGFHPHSVLSQERSRIPYSFKIRFHAQTAVQKFNYSYSRKLQKWSVFMRKIMKKFWLKFCIHAKFRAKKYLFRMNAQFRAKLVSYWKENDAEFRPKKSFRAKPRNCCARELTVSWKPYQYFNNIKKICKYML